MTDEHQHRAVRELNTTGRDFPIAWQVYDDALINRHKVEGGGWPDYVYAPIAVAIAVADFYPQVKKFLNGDTWRGDPFLRLAALASWRPTQGIYRIAPTLLDALWDTTVSGDLPADMLHRLPEWCVYVELNRWCKGTSADNIFIYGVWAHIDYEPSMPGGDERLCLLIDANFGLTAKAIPTKGSIRSYLDEVKHPDPRSNEFAQAMIEPTIAVLLYLCSAAAEYRSGGDAEKQPRNPKMRRDKAGAMRMRPAQKSRVWDTGTRMGAALDAAYAARAERAGGEGKQVAPHIRRAHWHAYWTGSPGSIDRRCEPRWLPPIPVNLDGVPSVATVRPVTGRRKESAPGQV